ncbi:MAG: 50S ribosomal protein L9 [Fusobacteriaceae bacterium]|nr:50S ribosomal protein L9 [Fusobacteriaceae bacterium]MBN2837836.1 50S ribosomal protein L9 [Fusobacteriaceae bacterium]
MSKLQVILTEDVAGHGRKGELVSVAEGYAKNFILKQKKGIIATEEEIKKLDAKKEKKEKEAEKKKDESKEIKKLLESKEINLKVKVGANGKVFGAITSKEVIDEIEKVFKIKIEKKKVEANFKAIGTHIAEIKLHQDVKASLKVVVTGE